MTFDVIIAPNDDAQWLTVCLSALGRAGYPAKKLSLFLQGTAFGGGLQAPPGLDAGLLSAFGSVQLYQDKNRGFGAACNAGAAMGSAPWMLFLTEDTEVSPGVFDRLCSAIGLAKPTTAAFECRRLPFEREGHIDPVSMEISCACAAPLAVRREAFRLIGGFDERLPGSCKNPDLSLRLRAAGFTLRYLPAAEVWCCGYDGSPATRRVPAAFPQPRLSEYAEDLLSDLLLRYKFGRLSDIAGGWAFYLGALRRPQHYPNVRRKLAKNFIGHLVRLWPLLFWRFLRRSAYKGCAPLFCQDSIPTRGFFALQKPDSCEKVSLIVRTFGRPEVLRRTLECLRWQTYPNFEVVVVEDGPPLSQKAAEEALGALPYRYRATGERVGRAKAGNIGLSMATGALLNFLDDDDYLYPDHIELLAGQLEAHPEAGLVTAASMAIEANVISKSPYVFETKAVTRMIFERMDRFMWCQMCLSPIQAVMFRRGLYERYGGLNEKLDGDEDWSMWLKYLAHTRRINPFSVDVPRATSLFMVPAEHGAAKAREDFYRRFEDAMLDDGNITFSVSPREMRQFYRGLLGDLRHLRANGSLDEYIDRNTERYL